MHTHRKALYIRQKATSITHLYCVARFEAGSTTSQQGLTCHGMSVSGPTTCTGFAAGAIRFVDCRTAKGEDTAVACCRVQRACFASSSPVPCRAGLCALLSCCCMRAFHKATVCSTSRRYGSCIASVERALGAALLSTYLQAIADHDQSTRETTTCCIATHHHLDMSDKQRQPSIVSQAKLGIMAGAPPVKAHVLVNVLRREHTAHLSASALHLLACALRDGCKAWLCGAQVARLQL